MSSFAKANLGMAMAAVGFAAGWWVVLMCAAVLVIEAVVERDEE